MTCSPNMISKLMAKLSIPEQLGVMREARVLAGAHGSQFVHCQFMPRNSIVIECFSPTYVLSSVIEICRALNHSYGQVVSRCKCVVPYPHGRDYYVDCGHRSRRQPIPASRPHRCLDRSCGIELVRC